MNLTEWVHVIAWVQSVPAWAVAIYSLKEIVKDNLYWMAT